jgi:hypothetical protein
MIDTYFFAGNLYSLALQACKRAQGMKSHGQKLQWDAIPAIVLAACSLEAFVNELTEYSQLRPDAPTSLREIQKTLDFPKLEIRDKYKLVAYLLGKPFDRGAPPYQNFALLVGLGNEIVHLKLVRHKVKHGQKLTIRTPNEVEELRKKGLTASDEFKTWYEQIMSAGTAAWACRSASEAVWYLIDSLPEGRFKRQFRMLGKGGFSRDVGKLANG